LYSLIAFLYLKDCNGDVQRLKCNGGSKCFYNWDRCDGWKDCSIWDEDGDIVTEDGTDEEDCPANNAPTTPEEEPITDVPILDVAPPATDN